MASNLSRLSGGMLGMAAKAMRISFVRQAMAKRMRALSVPSPVDLLYQKRQKRFQAPAAGPQR
ncbi:MAG: hypothetical protein AAF996_14895 [Pseudomonadota bacterium]